MPDVRGLLRALFATPGPAAAVSVAPGHVTAVRVEAGRKRIAVRGHARAALPDGAVRPAVQGSNLADAPAVGPMEPSAGMVSRNRSARPAGSRRGVGIGHQEFGLYLAFSAL